MFSAVPRRQHAAATIGAVYRFSLELLPYSSWAVLTQLLGIDGQLALPSVNDHHALLIYSTKQNNGTWIIWSR